MHMCHLPGLSKKGPHAGSLLQPAICIKAENRSPAKSQAQNKGNADMDSC